MTLKEKIDYSIGTELDSYVNLVQEKVITNSEVKDFILNTVIPRLTKLRDMVQSHKDENNI